MSAQHTPGARLSGAQVFVLQSMVTNRNGIFHLARNYDRTRHALQRKGLIVFNAERGMYEVTDSGAVALVSILNQRDASRAADWCEKCGVDVYVDSKCCAQGCGHIRGAAIAKATGASS